LGADGGLVPQDVGDTTAVTDKKSDRILTFESLFGQPGWTCSAGKGDKEEGEKRRMFTSLPYDSLQW